MLTCLLNSSTVQDATWYYNVTEGNPYKTESSVFFRSRLIAAQRIVRLTPLLFTGRITLPNTNGRTCMVR